MKLHTSGVETGGHRRERNNSRDDKVKIAVTFNAYPSTQAIAERQ